MMPTSSGLTQLQASERLAQLGPNALPEGRAKPLWLRTLEQFKNPLIYILLFALGVDLVFWVREGAPGFPFESMTIALILLLNAGLGVYQERKAEAALARLKNWPLRAFGSAATTNGCNYSLDTARSVAFQFLAVGQLLFVYPARHTMLRPLRNWTLHAVVVFGVFLQIAVGILPTTAQALGLEHLPFQLWVLILAAALLAWSLAELVNRAFSRE